jgi:hypothetical protein
MKIGTKDNWKQRVKRSTILLSTIAVFGITMFFSTSSLNAEAKTDSIYNQSSANVVYAIQGNASNESTEDTNDDDNSNNIKDISKNNSNYVISTTVSDSAQTVLYENDSTPEFADSVSVVVTVTGNNINLTELNGLTYSLDGGDSVDLTAGKGLGETETDNYTADAFIVDTKGSHTLTITAFDNAGNQRVNTVTFVIYTSPLISITPCSESFVYDGEAIEEGVDFILDKGGSDGLVSYSYKSKDDCEYTSGLPVNTGEYIIKAELAKDSTNFYNSTFVEEAITIDRKSLSDFKINTIGQKTYGDASFTLSVTGLPGSTSGEVTYISSDEGILKISGNTATILKSGTVTVTASFSGDEYYNVATTETTVTIAPSSSKKITQTTSTDTADSKVKTTQTKKTTSKSTTAKSTTSKAASSKSASSKATTSKATKSDSINKPNQAKANDQKVKSSKSTSEKTKSDKLNVDNDNVRSKNTTSDTSKHQTSESKKGKPDKSSKSKNKKDKPDKANSDKTGSGKSKPDKSKSDKAATGTKESDTTESENAVANKTDNTATDETGNAMTDSEKSEVNGVNDSETAGLADSEFNEAANVDSESATASDSEASDTVDNTASRIAVWNPVLIILIALTVLLIGIGTIWVAVKKKRKGNKTNE